jgi:hypothetical protein
MIRSIFIALCLIVLAAQMEQTEALAAIVRRVRNTGLFGIGRRAQRSTMPAQVVVPPSTPTTIASNNPSHCQSDAAGFAFESSFDADSYRREMIDLVYQRNLQRFHVN